jgi:hypothetical protein
MRLQRRCSRGPGETGRSALSGAKRGQVGRIREGPWSLLRFKNVTGAILTVTNIITLMPSAITIIDAVPNFVSLEEHASIVGATPVSFNDIPPVLRHKEENVSVMLDPPIEILRDLRGTLYVIERCES